MQNETVVSELNSSVKAKDVREPSGWQLFVLYTFPYWWTYVVYLLLYGITEICFFLGFNLVSHTGAALLIAPFVLAPFIVGTYLLGTRPWFSGQLVLAVVVWLVMVSFCGITQGAVCSAFMRATSYPGQGERWGYVERVPYNQR
jgi:hypothetical protein